MFQDFAAPPKDLGDPTRVSKLRAAMKAAGVDGFLVPRSDEHQGEYVPARAERLAWLTGFTGSAGTAVVLTEKAALFVDGRYTLQASAQVATDVIEPIHIADETLSDWLKANLSDGARLGFDPWLHTMVMVKRLTSSLEKAGVELTPVTNLIDAIWDDQPAAPKGPVILHPLAFAGRTSDEKLTEVQTEIRETGASACLLTQPDSVCWLLNIRGSDVPHTPLTLAFALVHTSKKPQLFIERAKIDKDILDAIMARADIAEPDDLLPTLSAVEGDVLLDPSSTSMIFKTHIEASGGTIIEGSDPCVLPKAQKNEAELAGARAAHIRDGVAMSRFLAWLSREPLDTLDEIAAAKALEAFRREEGARDGIALSDISFDTISGFGPNGAIVHYRVTEATNSGFSPNTLYLVDSGGQYADGTTDITRTVAIGKPSDEMKRHVTLVLKGMIAVSRLRFPKGTNGTQIDAFARTHLWQAGLDYDHGTGHGVGSFLSVHEGPQRISKSSPVELKPGMILSNEPGYYKQEDYGIRIENLIVVTEPEEIDGGDRPMMSFETLTFAPIDRALIEPDLMDAEELDWLNAYHAEVFEKLASRLTGEDLAWLKAATAPIAH